MLLINDNSKFKIDLENVCYYPVKQKIINLKENNFYKNITFLFNKVININK